MANQDEQPKYGAILEHLPTQDTHSVSSTEEDTSIKCSPTNDALKGTTHCC